MSFKFEMFKSISFPLIILGSWDWHKTAPTIACCYPNICKDWPVAVIV